MSTDLKDLHYSISELISVYNKINEIRFANIKSFVRTARKCNEKVILKDFLKPWGGITVYFTKEGRKWYKWSFSYFPQSLIFSNTGLIVNFLLERRMKKILNDIVSTLCFYNYYCDDGQKKLLENIMIEVTRYGDARNQYHEDKKYENIKAKISIIATAIGIFISPIGINEILKSLSMISPSSLLNAESQFMVVASIFLPSVIMLILETPLIWMIPQLSWYRKIIKVSDVTHIESSVYDNLIPLQRSIMKNFFPELERVFDKKPF